MPKTSLRTPADVVAAAAALLGFAPTNSVVVYMLHRDPSDELIVRCAIRFDITVTAAQAANFPATCNLRPVDNHAAILLAVCDERFDQHAHTVLDTLRDALDNVGIPVIRRIMTRDVTTEGQWLDPDSGAHGPTYPYTDALLTTQRILAGDRISRRRRDIEAEFAPIEPAPPVALGDHGELVTTTAEEIADALNGYPSAEPCPRGPASSSPPSLRPRRHARPGSRPSTGRGGPVDPHRTPPARRAPRRSPYRRRRLLLPARRRGACRYRHQHRARGSPGDRHRAASAGRAVVQRAASGHAPAADPPGHRRPRIQTRPGLVRAGARLAPPPRVGRAPFFFRSVWRRRAPRDRRTGHLTAAEIRSPSPF